MPRLLKFIPPAIFLITLIFTTNGLASSSTSGMFGESTSPISGWTISNIQYRFSVYGQSLEAVEFELDQPAGAVRVSLSSETIFFPCMSTGPNHWLCETHGAVRIADMTALTIVAVGRQD
jgi:hypothetical protein